MPDCTLYQAAVAGRVIPTPLVWACWRRQVATVPFFYGDNAWTGYQMDGGHWEGAGMKGLCATASPWTRAERGATIVAQVCAWKDAVARSDGLAGTNHHGEQGSRSLGWRTCGRTSPDAAPPGGGRTFLYLRILDNFFRRAGSGGRHLAMLGAGRAPRAAACRPAYALWRWRFPKATSPSLSPNALTGDYCAACASAYWRTFGAPRLYRGSLVRPPPLMLVNLLFLHLLPHSYLQFNQHSWRGDISCCAGRDAITLGGRLCSSTYAWKGVFSPSPSLSYIQDLRDRTLRWRAPFANRRRTLIGRRACALAGRGDKAPWKKHAAAGARAAPCGTRKGAMRPPAEPTCPSSRAFLDQSGRLWREHSSRRRGHGTCDTMRRW